MRSSQKSKVILHPDPNLMINNNKPSSPSTVGISDVPLELLRVITGYLGLQDQQTFVCLSKSFQAAMAPLAKDINYARQVLLSTLAAKEFKELEVHEAILLLEWPFLPISFWVAAIQEFGFNKEVINLLLGNKVVYFGWEEEQWRGTVDFEDSHFNFYCGEVRGYLQQVEKALVIALGINTHGTVGKQQPRKDGVKYSPGFVLAFVCLFDNIEVVQQVLRENGSTNKLDLKVVLCQAARYGALGIIKFLQQIEQPFRRPNINCHNHLPLRNSIKCGQAAVASYIFKQVEDNQSVVDLDDQIVMDAVYSKSEDTLKVVLEAVGLLSPSDVVAATSKDDDAAKTIQAARWARYSIAADSPSMGEVIWSASSMPNAELLQYLISAQQPTGEQLPLDYCGDVAIRMVCERGSVECVKLFLDSRRCDVSAWDYAAVRAAAQKSDAAIVRAIVESGVLSKSAASPWYSVALSSAAAAGSEAVIDYMLDCLDDWGPAAGDLEQPVTEKDIAIVLLDSLQINFSKNAGKCTHLFPRALEKYKDGLCEELISATIVVAAACCGITVMQLLLEYFSKWVDTRVASNIKKATLWAAAKHRKGDMMEVFLADIFGVKFEETAMTLVMVDGTIIDLMSLMLAEHPDSDDDILPPMLFVPDLEIVLRVILQTLNVD